GEAIIVPLWGNPTLEIRDNTESQRRKRKWGKGLRFRLRISGFIRPSPFGFPQRGLVCSLGERGRLRRERYCPRHFCPRRDRSCSAVRGCCSASETRGAIPKGSRRAADHSKEGGLLRVGL